MYTPKHKFVVAIDSDGCAFDTMELKQKECFAPNTIRYWGLQGVSKYAREAVEFVNLYSKSRGINRFPALVEALDWLARRPEVRARKAKIEVPQSLRDWIKSETKLGNPALIAAVERTGDPGLKKTLAWSEAINETVDLIVGDGVPPFPFVRETLEKLHGKADAIVVSATPHGALVREWEKQDIAKEVAIICGQEVGTKKESLIRAKKVGDYAEDHILMVGDAPGDYNAASAVGALFFPINPGSEEKSWELLYNEGLERFFNGTFEGDFQQDLLHVFNQYLPAEPPWPVEPA